MKVKFNGKEYEFDKKLKVKNLFDELKINENAYIVIDKKNKKLLPPDAILNDDSEVEIRRVISGG